MEIRSRVLAGERPEVTAETLEFLGDDFKILIDIAVECWNSDPFKRPRFQSIQARLEDTLQKPETEATYK